MRGQRESRRQARAPVGVSAGARSSQESASARGSRGPRRRARRLAPRSSWIGANFWSRAGGPRMWARYDAAVVREELTCSPITGSTSRGRSASGPTSCPRPGASTRDRRRAFRRLPRRPRRARGSARSRRSSSATCPGENWDPAWRQGRDLYRDVWLVSQQAWFAAEIAGRFGSHPAIVGWLVSNEMPLYGGPGDERRDHGVGAARRPGSALDRCDAADLARATVRGESRSPATTTAIRCASSRHSIDFVGPHVYPMQDDQVRQFLTAAFVCELSGGFGKPVVLEEFGVSSDFASDDAGGRLLPAGPAHLAARRRPRLDRLEQLRLRRPARRGSVSPPRVRDAFRSDRPGGPPEAPARRAAEFAALVRELDGEGWEPIKGGVAIVVPEHLERVLPFTTPAYRQDIRDNLLQSYVAALEADLPVQLVRERDGLADDAKLVLAPCAKLLTAPGSIACAISRGTARPSTSPTSPAARRTSAGRGWPG